VAEYDFDKTIQAFETDSLLIEYNTRKTGAFVRYIKVFSNGRTEPDNLYIKGVVADSSTTDISVLE